MNLKKWNVNRERNVSGELLVQQVNHYADKGKRIELASQFVDSASYNILRNLKYYQQRGRDLNNEIKEIVSLRKSILSERDDIEELMGFEGSIHKIYYSCWSKIFLQDVEFEKRVRRPPDNMVNTLISFLNTLVYTSCLSEIYVSQLNPTISYLHASGTRRFSLSLDIAEIFKPLLVDRLIFSLVNKKIVTENDFVEESNFCYMSETTQRKVTQHFNERLDETIYHRDLKRKVSYRRLIRLECYKLIKHLIGDKQYAGFKIWW